MTPRAAAGSNGRRQVRRLARTDSSDSSILPAPAARWRRWTPLLAGQSSVSGAWSGAATAAAPHGHRLPSSESAVINLRLLDDRRASQPKVTLRALDHDLAP